MNHDRDIVGTVEGWLMEPTPELSDRAIRDVIDRLPSTPQRRRWWPFHWFPFGIGAAPRTARKEPPVSPRRERQLRFAVRSFVAVAVLALVAGLTYATLFEPARELPLQPALTAPSPSPRPAPTLRPSPDPSRGAHVTGTSAAAMDESGDDTDGHLRGRHFFVFDLQMDDPRLMGESEIVMNADSYGGVGPEWGTLRFADDDGAWEGHVSGWHGNLETHLAGYLAGSGAYEGLTFYVEVVVDNNSATQRYEGVIFPGDAPTEYPPLP